MRIRNTVLQTIPRLLSPTFTVWLTLILAPLGPPLAVQAQAQEHWVGTWAAGLQAQIPPNPALVTQASDPSSDLFGPIVQIHNQTLRQIVRTSIGGSSVRVAFTNAFGTHPLEIGAAHIALKTDGPSIRTATTRALTFDGRSSTSIAAGSIVLSDTVALDVPALGHLAIDMYLPDDNWATQSPATGLRAAWTTNYLSASGNHSGKNDMPVKTTLQSWIFLARVEVTAPAATPVVVTLGDSITEGYGSTTDTDRRWPDVLASRLRDEFGNSAPAVLNVAISGNRLLRGNDGAFGVISGNSSGLLNPNAGFGPSGLDRFDRDVLLQPGITHIVVLESINDIGMTTDPSSPTVDELIAGHRALIQRAHSYGLTIYGGTLTPFEGALYFTEEGETKRQAVNHWIRSSGAYDAVIDFDAVVRDSSHPRRFLPMYHPGDWLHPNDEGYRAMGEAIDLTLFVATP